MSKKYFTIILLVVLMLFAACGKDAANRVSSDMESSVAESSAEEWRGFTIYKNNIEFTGIESISENHPIDKAYLEECPDMPSDTIGICAFIGKYSDLWQAEIDEKLEILRAGLGENSLKYLEESQKAWEVFRENEGRLVAEYRRETWGQGTGISIDSNMKYLVLTRERALYLTDYCGFLEPESRV